MGNAEILSREELKNISGGQLGFGGDQCGREKGHLALESCVNLHRVEKLVGHIWLVSQHNFNNTNSLATSKAIGVLLYKNKSVEF